MSKIDGTYKMKFGMHKGEMLQDLPDDYLQWLAENLEPERFNNAAIIEECENQLKLKGGEGIARPVPVEEPPHKGIFIKRPKRNKDEEIPDE